MALFDGSGRHTGACRAHLPLPFRPYTAQHSPGWPPMPLQGNSECFSLLSTVRRAWGTKVSWVMLL
jgi:hypothetical protein